MATDKPAQHRFRRTFITGLVISLPVLVSLWLVRFVFVKTGAAVTPLLRQLARLAGLDWLQHEGWVAYLAPVVSLLVLVAGIYAIGLIGGNVIGKRLLLWLDRLLRTIPVVRPVYTATRQFLETFSAEGNSFRKVVLVEYPRQGLWTLALLTADPVVGEVAQHTGARGAGPLVSVFIPTTPNPTSGWLLFVPKAEVIELDMSVDDAFKMIISGGVLMPQVPGTAAAR